MSGNRLERENPKRIVSLPALMSSLGRLFQPGYPFPDGAWKEAMPDGRHIAEYVQETIRNATEWMGESRKRAGLPGFSPSTASPKVAETARLVVVRVRVPPYRRRADVRVAHDPHMVFIRGVGTEPLRVPLPARVCTGGGTARIRNGMLEIRLRKSRKRRNRRELWVQY